LPDGSASRSGYYRRSDDSAYHLNGADISRNGLNARLNSYLRSEDRESLETTLGDLMESDAQPILRRVVVSRLSGLWDDIDDVCSEARLELLLYLRRVKAGTSGSEIADFPAYVATIAINACNRYFARRKPGRARLKKQIRVLLSEGGALRLRTSGDGRTWCELEGKAGLAATADLEELARRIEPERDLRRLLVRVLEEAGGALDLESVVELVSSIWRLPPDPASTSSGIAPDTLPAIGEEPGDAIDRRRFTVRLWQEIRGLPREQRLALLLHLRDHHGNSVLFLFPLTGVATFPEIAAALGMSEERLSVLWNDLPADDRAIGEILACARQRVINLRMSARKRLANRMRGRR
jgi:DNA-directed RNA polymerase specialized sigma24 family protein